MNLNKLQIIFFGFLVIFVAMLSFLIVKPFLLPTFIALIFSVVFYPMYQKILIFFGNRKSFSSILSVVLVAVLIIIPFALFSSLLVKEATSLYEKITYGDINFDFFYNFLNVSENYIQSLIPGFSFEIPSYLTVENSIKQILSVLMDNLSGIFSGFVRFFLGLFIMILAMFYFFKDGDKFLKEIIKLSPLSDEYDLKILGKVKGSINSVILGKLLVGIIQGVFNGIGFLIFGVPNPVLWAFLIAILSMLPLIGPMFVIVPAVLYLLFQGFYVGAILLFVWGIVSAFVIEDYLGAKIVDRGMKIHPFLILVSVLGGIWFFGPIGFIAGPVVLGLLFALLEIYKIISESGNIS